MKRVSAVVAEELRRVADSNGGNLTPDLVVRRASDKKSALHSFFTWDDKRAGELRRLDEARDLIQRVHVRLVTDPRSPTHSTRAWVSMASDRLSGGGYRAIEVVMSDRSQREELLRTAIDELHALQKKYEHLTELAEVFAALEEVTKKAS